MKAHELREMSDEQLLATLRETQESLFRLRVQSQTERLDAPSELLKSRRLIARIKTIQTQRLKAQQPDPSAEQPNGEPAAEAIQPEQQPKDSPAATQTSGQTSGSKKGKRKGRKTEDSTAG